MFSKIGIIFIYILLSMVNIWGFKQLSIEHEKNFYLRFLFKKIGIIKTQFLTIFIIICFILLFPLNSFLEGMIFGLFLFNTIHDYYIISSLLKEKREK